MGVLLGNGDGTFQPVVTYDSGGSTAVSVAVADGGGDGKPDLLVANECGTSTTCVQMAQWGTAGQWRRDLSQAKTYDTKYDIDSVAVADVNGDGKPDLLAANNNNSTVGVLLGNDSTFQPAVTYGSGGNSALSVAVADVNGDGKLDLLVGNQCDTSSNCAHGVSGCAAGQWRWNLQSAVSYDPSGTGAWSVAVADVNGDGGPDLVVAIFFTIR